MTSVELIRVIGVSHLLQPPLTLLLAGRRGVNLSAALPAKTRLAAEVQYNMAIASVGLPTGLGIVLAVHAREALLPGPGRTLAVLLSVFWCWRLYRQVFALGPVWPNANRAVVTLNRVLVVIFALQGPVLGFLLFR
jgi:hypothetical protein